MKKTLILITLFAWTAASGTAQTAPSVLGSANLAFRQKTEFAPGETVSVFGENLVAAGTGCQATGLPWPTEATECGLTVTVGDKACAIAFASSTQLTLQFPWDLELGETELVVTVKDVGSSPPFAVTIQRFSPAIASAGDSPAIQHSNNQRLVSPEDPAVEDEFLSMFATGLGLTENDPEVGAAPEGLLALLGTAKVFLREAPDDGGGMVAQDAGEREAVVLFAGPSPALVGIYTVVFRTPCGLVPGEYLLELEMSDPETGESVRSQAVTLPIGPAPLQITGVSNGASFVAGKVSGGTILSLFGTGFNTTSTNLTVFPAAAHEGLTVTINGMSAPLFAVAPNSCQINLLAPNDLPAMAESIDVQVQTLEKPSKSSSCLPRPAFSGVAEPSPSQRWPIPVG